MPPSSWKRYGSAACAVLLGLLFLVSGLWKLSDLNATAQRMVQSLIPSALSMPAASAVAVAEVFTAVLLLVPSLRRWGAWLASLMLIAFMLYIGILYDRLLGEDCNCFPWIQRVVGPVFFIGDGAMLLLAVGAGVGSRRPVHWRRAAFILGAVCLAAAGSWTWAALAHRGTLAPAAITVDGHPLNLRQGRYLLYFFDPQCSHCFGVAHTMSGWNWGATRVVAVPTANPQFAGAFLSATGLRAGVSLDSAPLRAVFPFTDPPYAVALAEGRAVATYDSGQLEDAGFRSSLRQLKLVP